MLTAWLSGCLVQMARVKRRMCGQRPVGFLRGLTTNLLLARRTPSAEQNGKSQRGCAVALNSDHVEGHG